MFYAVVYPVEREGQKTRWVRIGSAFPKDNGRIDVHIDSIPLNFNGRLFLFSNEDNQFKSDHEIPKPPKNAAPKNFAPPKIHMRDKGTGHQGICGHFAKSENLRETCEGVDCKNCLRRITK